jgi:protein-disulfide isomerase/uncharacterized membrane protein
MAIPASKKSYYLQLGASFSNILLSIYLLIQHTRLKVGIQEGSSFCSLGRFADCDVVNASQYSELAGVPVAALGALFYGFLLALGLLAGPKDKGFSAIQRVVLAFSTLGMAIDIFFFMSVQIFLLRSLCLLCTATFVIGLFHLYWVVRTNSRREESFWGSYRRQVRTGTWPKKNLVPFGRLAAIAICFLLFVGLLAVTPTYVKRNSAVYTAVDDSIEKFFLEWKQKPVRRMEVRDHNGTFGNPRAKVQIVAFSDFECPHCRKAAFTLHTLLHPLKDRVHFVFKHFPLNAACNPMLQYQMHAHACKLARLAVCANEKGKFWDFHDKVFLQVKEEVFQRNWEEVTKELGGTFSPEEITKCLVTSKSQAAVAEDVTLGITTKIQGTPSIFINGKLVTIPYSVQSLRRLIELEEKH